MDHSKEDQQRKLSPLEIIKSLGPEDGHGMKKRREIRKAALAMMSEADRTALLEEERRQINEETRKEMRAAPAQNRPILQRVGGAFWRGMKMVGFVIALLLVMRIAGGLLFWLLDVLGIDLRRG